MNLSWRKQSWIRVLGSAGSWFLFALCFTLLFLVSTTVMGLGGFCASGGPYVIAVECPDNVVAYAPLSIFGGLAAVAIGVFLAQGFGTPLVSWAWPILFCGLGLAFLSEFFGTGDPTGLIIGLMFEIMGVVPLILELRGSVQRVFLGQFNAAGVQFYEGESARSSLMSPLTPNPGEAVAPTAANWAASIGILVVACAAGIQVGRIAFGY